MLALEWEWMRTHDWNRGGTFRCDAKAMVVNGPMPLPLEITVDRADFINRLYDLEKQVEARFEAAWQRLDQRAMRRAARWLTVLNGMWSGPLSAIQPYNDRD